MSSVLSSSLYDLKAHGEPGVLQLWAPPGSHSTSLTCAAPLPFKPAPETQQLQAMGLATGVGKQSGGRRDGTVHPRGRGEGALSSGSPCGSPISWAGTALGVPKALRCTLSPPPQLPKPVPRHRNRLRRCKHHPAHQRPTDATERKSIIRTDPAGVATEQIPPRSPLTVPPKPSTLAQLAPNGGSCLLTSPPQSPRCSFSLQKPPLPSQQGKPKPCRLCRVGNTSVWMYGPSSKPPHPLQRGWESQCPSGSMWAAGHGAFLLGGGGLGGADTEHETRGVGRSTVLAPRPRY